MVTWSMEGDRPTVTLLSYVLLLLLLRLLHLRLHPLCRATCSSKNVYIFFFLSCSNSCSSSKNPIHNKDKSNTRVIYRSLSTNGLNLNKLLNETVFNDVLNCILIYLNPEFHISISLLFFFFVVFFFFFYFFILMFLFFSSDPQCNNQKIKI